MDHEALRDALTRAGLAADASEAHGLLCGALCVRAGFGAGEWLAELEADPGIAAPEPDAGLLRLPGHVLDALGSDDLDFQPLLPEDDAPIAERATALAAWCGGFLYGIGSGASKPAVLRTGDVGEFLGDLAEIARAEVGAGSDPEAGESDYFELVEFVRAGAQLAFIELAEARSHAA